MITFLPVVERELRIASRNQWTYWTRLSAAGLAFTIACCMSLIGFPTANTGQGLFGALSFFAALFCLVDGTRTTADCISEEKREGTLGLLFLTDLSGFDVILGKLASTALRSFYGLLATFPVLGISLLMGGVTAGEFWRMVAALVAILLLSQSVAICASAVMWTERAAHSWAVVILGMIVLFPLIPGWIARFGPTSVLWEVDVFSPITLFQSTFAGASPSRRFALALLANLSVAALFFIAAGKLVGQRWQLKPVEATRSRRAARWRGVDEPRRRRLLDINPIAWLSLRFHRPGLEWAPVSLFVAIVVASVGLGPEGFWTFALSTGWLMNFLVKLRLATEGARMGADLRKDSQLELLLTTPLGSARIVEGLGTAIKALIFPGAIALLVVELFTLVIGFMVTRQSNDAFGWPMVLLIGPIYLGLTLCDFHAFAHTALFHGFASGKTSVGINRTQLRLIVGPFVAAIIFSVGMRSPVGYFVGYVFSVALFFQSQSRMNSEFASIATGQMDPIRDQFPSFIFPSPPASPPDYRI